MWLFASTILVGTLAYGWYSGDIAFGRLNKIPLPKQFQWYHALAPALLLGLTRYGIPVSTTLLTLSAFSSSLVLEIYLGDSTPSRDGFYVKLAGKKNAYVINSSWADVVTRLITQPPYPLEETSNDSVPID